LRKALTAVILTRSPQTCALNGVLEVALSLIGHQPQKWPGGLGLNSWVISSYNGQVVYPRLFEIENPNERGYLILSWAPGLFRFDGEVYQLGLDGASFTLDSTIIPGMADIPVTMPRNLCPDQEVIWRVSSTDGWLIITLALGKNASYSPRSPSFILKNMAWALVVESCAHDPESQLASSRAWLTHSGPLKPLGDIHPSRNQLNIDVIAVNGEERLRMYTLASNNFEVMSRTHYEASPMVLRVRACLACCLEVCHKANYRVVVC
jgi:hypothetical protein